MTKLAAMNLKTMRDNIRFARLGRSGGFAYLSPTGCPCRIIPPGPGNTLRASMGMHVQITFWSRPNEPIFEVHAQSLN